jgi:hypothetical protein
MGIRIRPAEIDFPALNQFAPDAEPTLDPFKGDLLDRKEKIEVLTRLVGNVEGPCTVAVDAAWGAGKTTFLKMWARHLCQQGFPVVEFNAWETDFTGEPFVALSSEITEGLAEWDSPTVVDRIKETKETARKVLRWVAPGAIRLASGFIPIVGNEVGKAAGDYAEELLTDYPEARRSVNEFQTELEELAAALWESSEHKPLVVFIDELDRCRPTYAIELLETGKHIFSVDHVVFVLAVNREELAKSVAVLYGDEFDAEGYLKRFFDIDFWLPEPARASFVNSLMDQTGINQYLGSEPRQSMQSRELVRAVLIDFLAQSDLSLRGIGQAIHRLGLVFASLSEEEYGYTGTVAALAVINALDSGLYGDFVESRLTDQEMVDAISLKYEDGHMEQRPSGLFMQAIIIASRIAEHDTLMQPPDLQETAPLFWHYREKSEMKTPSNLRERLDVDRAREIMGFVYDLHSDGALGADNIRFNDAVERFNLLSSALLGRVP